MHNVRRAVILLQRVSDNSLSRYLSVNSLAQRSACALRVRATGRGERNAKEWCDAWGPSPRAFARALPLAPY